MNVWEDIALVQIGEKIGCIVFAHGAETFMQLGIKEPTDARFGTLMVVLQRGVEKNGAPKLCTEPSSRCQPYLLC